MPLSRPGLLDKNAGLSTLRGKRDKQTGDLANEGGGVRGPSHTGWPAGMIGHSPSTPTMEGGAGRGRTQQRGLSGGLP